MIGGDCAVGSMELVTRWAIINIHTFTAVIPQINSQFCVLKGIPERVLDLPSCPCYSVGLLWWFDEESRQSWNLFTLVAVVAFQSKLIPEISGETPRRRHPIPRTRIRTRITIRDQILVTIEERLKHWKNDIIFHTHPCFNFYLSISYHVSDTIPLNQNWILCDSSLTSMSDHVW